MDYPLHILQGAPQGREGILRVTPMERETCFEVMNAPAGPHRVYIQGRQGRLLLGVTEQGQLRRRFSHTLTAPVGELLCAQAEQCAKQEGWRSVPPEHLVEQLLPPEAKYRDIEGGYELALPYGTGQPFPWTELFCFGRIETIFGEQFAVFAFDKSKTPRLP